MACTAIGEPDRARESRRLFGRLLRIVAGIVRGTRPGLPRLELEILPDHVKRDLGFLDGRDPRYEDERAR